MPTTAQGTQLWLEKTKCGVEGLNLHSPPHAVPIWIRTACAICLLQTDREAQPSLCLFVPLEFHYNSCERNHMQLFVCMLAIKTSIWKEMQISIARKSWTLTSLLPDLTASKGTNNNSTAPFVFIFHWIFDSPQRPHLFLHANNLYNQYTLANAVHYSMFPRAFSLSTSSIFHLPRKHCGLLIYHLCCTRASVTASRYPFCLMMPRMNRNQIKQSQFLGLQKHWVVSTEVRCILQGFWGPLPMLLRNYPPLMASMLRAQMGMQQKQ